jgi:hypothetical protein
MQDSYRELSVKTKSPAQAPINMHMEMNLSPMTREIEKLRTYITTLIDSMANNKSQGDQKALEDIKHMLNFENNDLRKKMKIYKEKIFKL